MSGFDRVMVGWSAPSTRGGLKGSAGQASRFSLRWLFCPDVGQGLEIVAGQLQAAAARYIDKPGELLDYRMALEMSGALWQLAFKRDPAGDRRVVQEMHENAWAFLQPGAFRTVGPADTRSYPQTPVGPP